MVKQILYGNMVDMGGIPLRQPLPTQNVEQIDPFLLLHHATFTIEEGSDPKNLGVGPHPHRGFSPVTFIFDGDVHHRDSRGNSSIIKAGGVQWMNAGMGIIHSERPSAHLAQKGGTQEIIQLWINTPHSQKMNQPKYQAFQSTELSQIAPHISLVAGKEKGLLGPVNPEIPVKAVMGTLAKGSSLTLSVDHMHSFLYLLNGAIRLNGHGLIEQHNMVWIADDTYKIEMVGMEETKFIFLSADPLEEPLTTYGPFVMSNQTEIMKAMRDYQMGKMGVLIEEF